MTLARRWSDPESYNIKFPEDSDVSLKQIWQIANDPHDADTLYCGVEPAALFKSADAGETWSLERGLFDHPHRPQWMPGGGGLCLHTILPDPSNSDRMWVAISTGGVYRTEDGGKNWQPRNQGIRAPYLPPDQQYPEWGQCVHKVVSHPSNPDRMFLQHHWGVYRSDDAGDSWQDIGKGLPSDFGFAMEIDPNHADTVFIIPIESDEFRCTPEAKAARLSHARWRRFMGAFDQWFAARRRPGNDSARQHESRCEQSDRTLLRHAQRQVVWLGKWRRLVDHDPRRLAADHLREDGDDQLTTLSFGFVASRCLVWIGFVFV